MRHGPHTSPQGRPATRRPQLSPGVVSVDDRKFPLVERAAAHFAAKYPVNTIDGVRMTFPEGWGLIRASNTQPVIVLRFEATSQEALDTYRAEVAEWLAGQGVRA